MASRAGSSAAAEKRNPVSPERNQTMRTEKENAESADGPGLFKRGMQKTR